MTKKEKLELYNKAKEAYYNGEEIMSDYEFDALEKELGLENKSEVGSRHNPSYTIVHPFIMGSLSKVQIHKDKDGIIDWTKYYNEMLKYIDLDSDLIITPKYDGCSFECEIKDHTILQISSRGDGEYGKELTQHLAIHIPQYLVDLDGHNVFRGEVLVKKSVFEKKYSEKFTNPRSFVSGVLNRDYDRFDPEFQEMVIDLSIVVYDCRSISNGKVTDYDWDELDENLEFTPNFVFYANFGESTPDEALANFECIYEKFAEYRHNCEYALDGYVIKPTAAFRENNLDERRPKDCVAIKFIPILQETEVTDITWNVAKTGEYVPIIWVNPVEMDGKIVKKCSGSNYGNLIKKQVSVGSKIIMSLAGDIIPFLYKVTNVDNFDVSKIDVPEDSYLNDIHLMKVMNEKDKAHLSFINSAECLQIPNIGNESANKIFEYISKDDEMTLEFFNEEPKELIENILLCSSEDIYYGLNGGKSGDKAKKSFNNIIENLTLTDIIKSCNFRFCGPKVADKCAEFILTGDADFEHLSSQGYEWCKDNDSEEMQKVKNIVKHLGKSFEDFQKRLEDKKEESSNQIPIIMTGEPNNYSTKSEFLRCHPEYRNTGSWKEVQIVFTNSLESNTGKMKKAREKGIRIELY